MIEDLTDDFYDPYEDEEAHDQELDGAPVAVPDALCRALLDDALPTDLIDRLCAGEPLCVVISPPGPGWGALLRTDIRRRLAARGAIDPLVEILVREAAVRSDSDLELLRCLWEGTSLLAIAPDPGAMLPAAIVRAADLRVQLPAIAGRHLRAVILDVTGEDPGDIPDARLGGLELLDVAASVRRGATGAACAARLIAMAEERTRSRSEGAPLLETLAGYGDAKEWGMQLVREVARHRAGAIGLADLPRGALISGPPGTGKTLLVQSLARSAGLPLVATSFGEWMGAGHLGDSIARMRATFAEARRLKPCILFTDEIDAAVDPASETGGSKSFWMSFRSALLSEVDGASSEPGIVLIGACNHEELVDRALRRAGRLDRHIEIGLPDREALADILRHHLGEDLPEVDLAGPAQLALGRSGADIATMVRSARARARDAGRPIAIADLLAELCPADERDGATLRRVALHEAGHAVAAALLGYPIDHVSVVQRQGSAGRMALAASSMPTLAEIEAQATIALAGRAVDVVVSGSPCAGAAADLVIATRLLAASHARWGLRRTLLACADDESVARRLEYDAELRGAVEGDLERLWTTAVSLVEARRPAIDGIADALLERRIIPGAEVPQLIRSLEARARRRGGRQPPTPDAVP
ncbi:AAA family ATPase [Salinarimonas rosea]|uniref:AAA family ATPase n=1 Tax=Salinarimonas rosea TaxID=552063 RepID=UPI0004220094|nr:AAA family ATPase [Salinarimonas rosea]